MDENDLKKRFKITRYKLCKYNWSFGANFCHEDGENILCVNLFKYVIMIGIMY